MTELSGKQSRRVCPKTGRLIDSPPGRPWALWLMPAIGLVSLIWFLIRVLPKPSRAAYPCQRVAFPLASSFIIWLMGVTGSMLAFWKLRRFSGRMRTATVALTILVGLAAGYFAIAYQPQATSLAVSAFKTPDPVNDPMGVAQGINPGRVVWVRDAAAVNWDESWGDWYDTYQASQSRCDDMLAKGVRWLTGEDNDADAWDALFRHTNRRRGKGDIGWQAGEKIAIKVNLTLGNVDNSQFTTTSGDRVGWVKDNCGMTKQLMRSLLRSLVYDGGVDPACIYIGDPTAHFHNDIYIYLASEFPDVHYMTGPDPGNSYNMFGREDVDYASGSDHQVHWSTSDAIGKNADHVPQYYANAEYFINMPVLKSHSPGITVCGKNNYGSLVRRPPGNGGATNPDQGPWLDLHPYLPANGSDAMGSYRPMVDLMGHPDLGGKGLLYLVDALYTGYGWGGIAPPQKWRSDPSNGDWLASILLSQDPVAVDSVAYDMYYAEGIASWDHWPFNMGGINGHQPQQAGADDYLHEAAMAPNPASGTFYDPDGDGVEMTSQGVHEHWNNATDRKYTRNLGTGYGIELITAQPNAPVARHIFYNNSRYDGYDVAATGADDAAIATDKTPLRPGQTATFANYTSYAKGINGVMIDVPGLGGVPTSADFTFRVGNDSTPGDWSAAPAPASITVRPGAGVGGSDRVMITWADGAITKQWLEVRMKANAVTGLTVPDVFYVGNALGDTGDSAGSAAVTATDEAGARNNPHTLAHDPADITDAYDIDRDGRVGPTDAILIRNNGTSYGAGTALELITAP